MAHSLTILTTPLISPQVSSAIASVEDALGLPSPEDLAEGKDINTEEVSKQADGKLVLVTMYHVRVLATCCCYACTHRNG